MKLLVTGGRTYHDQLAVWTTLDRIHAACPIALLIHGAARGADALAGQWASKENVPVDPYPVHRHEWDRLGKRAGVVRNAAMLRMGNPDAVLAFPGEMGTADMVTRANKAGVPVLFAAEMTELCLQKWVDSIGKGQLSLL